MQVQRIPYQIGSSTEAVLLVIYMRFRFVANFNETMNLQAPNKWVHNLLQPNEQQVQQAKGKLFGIQINYTAIIWQMHMFFKA